MADPEELMEEGDDLGVGMDEESESDVTDDEEEDGAMSEPRVFIPGQEIGANETLVCDESAYIMYHQAQTGEWWPLV